MHNDLQIFISYFIYHPFLWFIQFLLHGKTTLDQRDLIWLSWTCCTTSFIVLVYIQPCWKSHKQPSNLDSQSKPLVTKNVTAVEGNLWQRMLITDTSSGGQAYEPNSGRKKGEKRKAKFPQNSMTSWNWWLSICLSWDAASFIISCSLYQGRNAHHKRPQVLIKCNIYTLRMFNFLLSQHAGK